jgi:hypothetical protein
VARIRTVKPSFFRHEGLQDLERAHPGAHVMLVFAGLWTVADGAGRFLWRPRQFKLDILPFLDFDMDTTLALLVEGGFIQHYTVDGTPYGAIPTFRDHQRITGKEAQEGSKIPAPEQHKGRKRDTTGKQRGNTGEIPVAQEGKGKEGNGLLVPSDDDGTTDGYPPDFDLTWHAYPKRAGGNAKKDAYKAWCARRAAGVDFDILHDGVLRYAAYCHAMGKNGTEFVMQAARFFGPSQQYAQPWELPEQRKSSAPELAVAARVFDLCVTHGFTAPHSLDQHRKRAEALGADGTIRDVDEFMDAIARVKPWEVLRGVRTQDRDKVVAEIARRLAA